MMGIESQAEFAAALLDPARPVPPGLQVWNGSDPARRFAVYRNNVMSSLMEALASTFPVTRALVGAEFFDAMARAFIAAAPPRSRMLVEHGGGLPDFISGFAPAADLPYLADVARIEALRVLAYHAADAVPLEADSFRPLLPDPERLAATHVLLHPACHWLRSRHAAFSLWAAHQQAADLDPADLDAVDLSGINVDTPEDILVARPALVVQTLALPVGGAAFLDALAAGQPLGAAVAQAAAVHPEFDPATLLALVVQQGLAIGLTPVAIDAASTTVNSVQGLSS